MCVIETTGINEFSSIFENMNICLYDNIYISLGSKYNGIDVITYNMANKTIQKKSNAKYQMIPEFIRSNIQQKTLAICIDRFENDTIKNENVEFLSEYTWLKTIVCDIDGTIQIFESIIDIIINVAVKNNISSDKLIIVNYIRFIHPNHTESYLEENLSAALQKRLCIYDKKYEKCLYEWFGYQTNLYNIIYRYNVPIIYVIIRDVLNILQKNIDNNEICIDDIAILRNSNINTRFLYIFLENSYDITQISNEFLPLYLHR